MGWTEAQQKCIDTRGGNVLVSAAAGSGKTTVLVERVATRIADKTAPVDIDRLLIVTFTQAAAAEMKQRLAKRLATCIQEDPDNAHLARQQMLLPSAQISTIHGFCTAFLRENFEAAGVSPRFTIAEANAVKLLQGEALDETLEIFYAAAEDGFLTLCKIVNGAARNDKNVRNRILRVYEAIQAQPFPLQWLREACTIPDKDASLFDTVWGQKVREHANRKLQLAEECVTNAVAPLALMEQYAAFYARIGEFPAVLRNALCVVDDTANGWDDCKRAVEGIQAPVMRGKGDIDPAVLEPIENAWNLAKAVTKELKGYFARTQAEEKAALLQTEPVLQALYALVETFSERFAAKKQERGWLDFNDLEHFTLRLLCDEQTQKPTQLARETAAKYTEIYVDEYQDTNEAQDTIFRMLGCETNTAFFVGDVKQSIYGFRQANPQIFLDKKQAFSSGADKTASCITLEQNFRSRAEVTETVNFVCNQVMTTAFCSIAYQDGEQLAHGATDAEGVSPVEILLADDTFSAAELNAETLEARIIAQRIENLLKNGWVTDKDAQTGESIQRPVEYKDICILLRGRGSRPISYANALAEKGIPVQKDKTLPLFAAEEVGMALNFLRVVDNPLLDIPLMSVMVSSVVGFTADECAQIRIAARQADERQVPLYTALLLAEQGEITTTLREKITAFLRSLRHYRRLAATMGAEEFINRLYDDTGMLLFATAQPDGAQKLANLRGIVEMARHYEQNGFRGLSAFVRYIDRMEAEHPDMEAPHPAGQANAVSIMTIHGSKGLEFPIVILANMTKGIREDASTEVFCMHNTAGAAVCVYDEDLAETQKTAAFDGVQLAKRYTEYAEEARLLYVALTRAKDKLICVYANYRLEQYIAKLAKFVPSTPCISAAALMEMGSVGEWLLAALFRHPDAHFLRHLANATDIQTLPCAAPLEVQWLDAGAYLDVDDAAKTIITPQHTAQTVVSAETVFDRISYRYAYTPLSTVPVKIAASSLAHRDMDGAFVATNRPAFLNEEGMTPAEKGTALHAFMQFANFDVAVTNPEKEAERLYQEGFLSEQARDALDMERIRAFFKHPLYARLQKADAVWREYAFTVPLSVAAIDASLSDMADETLIVQGIADCVFEENGELVIVDYKTDRVKDIVTLRERYKKQLDIYRDALQQTTGKRVKETLLYAFYLNDTVET